MNDLHPAMIDKALGKHITPVTLKSTIKSNPLYSDGFTDDSWEERKNNPSWTVQDYERRFLNSSLAHYLKVSCHISHLPEINEICFQIRVR